MPLTAMQPVMIMNEGNTSSHIFSVDGAREHTNRAGSGDQAHNVNKSGSDQMSCPNY